MGNLGDWNCFYNWKTLDSVCVITNRMLVMNDIDQPSSFIYYFEITYYCPKLLAILSLCNEAYEQRVSDHVT